MSERPLRIAIGAALIATLAAVVVVDRLIGAPLLGTAVLLAVTLAAQSELLVLLRAEVRPLRLLLFAVTTMLFVLSAFAARQGSPTGAQLAAALSLGFAALLVFEIFRFEGGREAKPETHAADLAAAAAALIYLALPMSLYATMAWSTADGLGSQLVAIYILISKCGDIGGYLGGSAFGKRRILPRVSPKKSWEGSLCGLALTLAVALIFHAIWPEFFAGLGVAGVVIFALVVNVATQLGDFAESMIKRSRNVKDSAQLLPTFGGALDILDSLVFAAPAALLALWLLG